MAVASCLPPVELLALCATSKAMEARFVVTVDSLPLGPHRSFSHCRDHDIDNDLMHHHIGTIVSPPSYLLGGLLSRVGRFVRRIDLRCTEDSINDGVFSILVGAHRGKVNKLNTESEGVSHQLLLRLVEILRHRLTGLEELSLTVIPDSGNNADPLSSALAAAALQYCSNLIKLELMEDVQKDNVPRPFHLLPLVQALHPALFLGRTRKEKNRKGRKSGRVFVCLLM